MRPWLSLATILALCIPLVETAAMPPRCPSTSVCAIFVNCGASYAATALFWDADTVTACPVSTSPGGTIWRVLAAIEIQPLSLVKWKVVKTHSQELSIKDIKFRFGDDADAPPSEFVFLNESAMQFTWHQNATSHSAIHSMTGMDSIQLWHALDRHSFEIEAKGEKLISLFDASKIKFSAKDSAKEVAATLEDRRIPKILERLSPCNFSEIKQGCHGICDEITVPASSAKLHCTSQLWHRFTTEVETNDWKTIDAVRCSKGTWLADWSRGILFVDESIEFQCSAAKPVMESTGLSVATQAICGSIGGIVVLIIVVIGAFYLQRFLKRRAHTRKGSGSKGKSSGRVGDSPRKDGARTPGEGGSKKERMQEYTAQTDIDGLHTEILEEQTATAHATKPERNDARSPAARTPGAAKSPAVFVPVLPVPWTDSTEARSPVARTHGAAQPTVVAIPSLPPAPAPMAAIPTAPRSPF